MRNFPRACMQSCYHVAELSAVPIVNHYVDTHYYDIFLLMHATKPRENRSYWLFYYFEKYQF